MSIKAIAHSYWRSIKRGNRTFASIPNSVKDDVRTLAKTEVMENKITPDDYSQFIGETYTEI